jgi:hypothetical protein
VNDGSTVDVADRETVPATISLRQNYPNPLNPATRIVFKLPEASPETLQIFDLLGPNVATPVEDVLSAGTHVVEFDGTALSTGTYFYRLTTPIAVESKRMLLLR